MIDSHFSPSNTSFAEDAAQQPAAVSRTSSEHYIIQEPDRALPPLHLEELPPLLQQACADAGWKRLMPVQERALPYLLQGRDIMVQSRTGSGKTGAYLLPLPVRLDPNVAAVQALILVPTRELAAQVEKEARTLFKGTALSVAAVYGGVGYNKQVEALKAGVTVVVGTPGRVLDHLLRRTLVLNRVSSLVFDEADRMLSIGFYPDMKEIQRYLPAGPLHATLFSATYPPHVLKLAGEFLHNPELLSLSSRQVHVAEVEHRFCETGSMEKDRTLLRILEVENPGSAIVFCNTKANVHFVTAVLQGFGFNADELSADLSQSRREEVLARLRKGDIRFLVATDVAARGIDIPDLSHVILYEPPEDRESYIHRAGRTGRAGAAGVVISLVDIMERLELERIARFYKIELHRIPVPDDAEVSAAVNRRLTALLEARFRQLTGLERERLKRFGTLAHDLAVDPEQAPLLTLLLDDAYTRNLNPTGPVPSGCSEMRGEKRSESRGRSRRSRSRKKTGGNNAEVREPSRSKTAETPTPSDAAATSGRRPRRRRRPPVSAQTSAV